MSTAVAVAPKGDIMETVLIKGDLAKLTPQERNTYYLRVCESIGLNPLTRPFEYITLNNKLTLYARKDCTEQLRTLKNVSVEELTESEREGVFIVTAKVRNGEGRTDMAKGAVTITGLKGDALANALMKAETKAKRRATLSLCGLGFLDEAEVETIPDESRKPAIANVSPISPQVQVAHDPETGEVAEEDEDPRQLPIEAKDWLEFGRKLIAAVEAAISIDDADAIEAINKPNIEKMKKEAQKLHAGMVNAIAKARAKIVKPSEMVGDGEVAMAG